MTGEGDAQRCTRASSLTRALFLERIVLPGRASPHRRRGRDPLPSACLPVCLPPTSPPSTRNFVALATNNRRWQSHCALALLVRVRAHGRIRKPPVNSANSVAFRLKYPHVSPDRSVRARRRYSRILPTSPRLSNLMYKKQRTDHQSRVSNDVQRKVL